MKLYITKIYLDSRFKTKNSKSDSDFSIELPRSFNVPDGVVVHIDDIVIPVSWSTIDERNNKCYISVFVVMQCKMLTLLLILKTMRAPSLHQN